MLRFFFSYLHCLQIFYVIFTNHLSICLTLLLVEISVLISEVSVELYGEMIDLKVV